MINPSTYKLYLMMCEEIKKHKWIESEKAGKDIGFENALVDWIDKHRSEWAKHKFDNIINEK